MHTKILASSFCKAGVTKSRPDVLYHHRQLAVRFDRPDRKEREEDIGQQLNLRGKWHLNALVKRTTDRTNRVTDRTGHFALLHVTPPRRLFNEVLIPDAWFNYAQMESLKDQPRAFCPSSCRLTGGKVHFSSTWNFSPRNVRESRI